MRALVTGATGFVGGYLLDALRRDGAKVFACSGPNDHKDGEYLPIDLNDPVTIRAVLAAAQPDVIFHLAAQTFVPAALREPIETYETNTMGTARLLAALRSYAGARPRVFFASSAEVYGVRNASDYPLRETLELRPANPYGASKAAAEAILAAEMRCFGLDVVIARAFNHIGPGQNDRFVVSALAAQLARIAAGGSPQLYVGNLEAARDFLDVRDVVRAYILLAQRGESGEIYNVSSGKAVTIRDVLRELITIARVPVEVREDPARMRRADIPLLVGDPNKLYARTGWQPQIPLVRSLREIFDAARSRAAAAVQP